MSSCTKLLKILVFCLAAIFQLSSFAGAMDSMVWDDVTKLLMDDGKIYFYNVDDGFESSQNGAKKSYVFDKLLAQKVFSQSSKKEHLEDKGLAFSGISDFTSLNTPAQTSSHILRLLNIDETKTSIDSKDESSLRINVDINAIQASYDTKEEPSSVLEREVPISPPDISDAPDVCKDGSIDAATLTQNGNTYLFKGDYYWKIDYKRIAVGYPRRIQDDWNGLEGNLDAAFTWSNGRTYFFKGKHYWRFRNKEMDPGYPKLISQGFKGIPDDIDAAVVWSNNSKTYFYKGDKYWRFDSTSDIPVKRRYPQPLSVWEGLPDNIDAAIQWENGKTYFFKGDQYYRFNDDEARVESSEAVYPAPTSVNWFYCKQILKEAITQ